MAGILCGLTIYLKPSGAPFVAGAGILLLILAWGDGLKQVAGAVAALIAGFALAFIPLLAYFAAHGALGDLYQTIVVFNSYHARIGGNPTLAGSVTGTLDFLASMNILAPLALAGAWGMWQEFSAHRAGQQGPVGPTALAPGGRCRRLDAGQVLQLPLVVRPACAGAPGCLGAAVACC